MTPDQSLRDETAKWFREVEKDLNSARALIDIEASRSVFHSQQAAEKSIKGYLTFREIAFRKTHDLADLAAQCPAGDLVLDSLLQQAEGLTGYASAFRYPDAPYEPDGPEALEAVELAMLLHAEILRRVG